MAVISFTTARAVCPTHLPNRGCSTPAAVPNVISFAQAKAMREMPTYLRGGRI